MRIPKPPADGSNWTIVHVFQKIAELVKAENK